MRITNKKLTPLLSSRVMDWQTPPDIFANLDARFHFTLDAAASPHNAKCTRYFTKKEDALLQSWAGERVFCDLFLWTAKHPHRWLVKRNPPYGRELPKWVRKAWEESRHAECIVLLVPARTDTTYFHDFILDKARIEFIRGRLRFLDSEGNPKNAAPFPSMLVIYQNK